MRTTNEREAVRKVQEALRVLGWAVPIDGIYGEATRDAVSEFQRAMRLPVTGTVDRATWDILMREAIEARDRELVRSISPFPRHPQDYAIAQGEESELVALLHHMLRTLSVDYDSLDSAMPQGRFYGDDTARAVRSVQVRHALPETGTVDRATWNALAEAYDRALFRD